MSIRNPQSVIRYGRRGLAPLELVLALPMLMAVLALMIVFGNTAYWKVRGLTVTRNAAWSNRWPRAGFDEPTPQPFTPRQYSHRGIANLTKLDPPELQHEVVRGPLPNGFNVNEKLLNPARGMTEGYAEAKIQPPMMSTVPGFQHFKFNLNQELLDDKFQYPQMGIPANVHRRIPFIYELPKADSSVSQAWVSAALAVINAPFREDLAPLDRDEEIFSYYGHHVDFHPTAARFCSLDLRSAWDNQARRLIDRIKGNRQSRVSSLPERMTNFWISMYRSQLAAAQNGMNPDPVEAEAIQQKLKTLLDFRQRLRNTPTPPDGPAPRLASSAGEQEPLQPIPAALLRLMSSAETSCCGAESAVESLLRRLLDVDAEISLE